MLVNRTYHSWLEELRQLQPKSRITLVRNLAWLIAGLYHSRSVHLSDIAEELPCEKAKFPSIERKLSRLLANPALQVRKWYRSLAEELVHEQARTTQEIRLVVDATKIGFTHQLLMVAIAYQRRAIPLAWTWIPYRRGHSSVYKQAALLAYVRSLLPANTAVLVVGDAEFGHVELLRLLESWGWHYVLRQRSNYLVQTADNKLWRSFGSLATYPGQSHWLQSALLTAEHAHPTNLLIHWQVGEKLPWLLASNLETKSQALQAYRRRMWLDEMFGDFKRHGFDLESTHLQHFQRLSRLTLAVSLLYLWLLAQGSRAIKQGLRHLVDRHDRRDRSLFTIGRRFVKYRLHRDCLLHIALVPLFR